MQVTRDEIQKRVERWRQLIIPEWNVVLKADPPTDVPAEDLGRGRCETNPELRSVKVLVNTARIDDGTDLDETIVHELLHAAFDELLDPVRSHLTELSPQTASAVRRQIESLYEPLIERLARVVVSLGRPEQVYRTAWDPTEDDSSGRPSQA